VEVREKIFHYVKHNTTLANGEMMMMMIITITTTIPTNDNENVEGT
jgi:hypothetical protein